MDSMSLTNCTGTLPASMKATMAPVKKCAQGHDRQAMDVVLLDGRIRPKGLGLRGPALQTCYGHVGQLRWQVRAMAHAPCLNDRQVKPYPMDHDRGHCHCRRWVWPWGFATKSPALDCIPRARCLRLRSTRRIAPGQKRHGHGIGQHTCPPNVQARHLATVHRPTNKSQANNTENNNHYV